MVEDVEWELGQKFKPYIKSILTHFLCACGMDREEKNAIKKLAYFDSWAQVVKVLA